MKNRKKVLHIPSEDIRIIIEKKFSGVKQIKIVTLYKIGYKVTSEEPYLTAETSKIISRGIIEREDIK